MPAKKTIILLAGEKEYPFLKEFILERNDALSILAAPSAEMLREEVRRVDGKARLLSFLNDLIVPTDVLETLSIAPYNIHPGPPEYPGVHPESFAIWEEAARFGVTAHEMTAKVDEGPIVALSRFDMPDNADRPGLSDLVLRQALKVFAVVADHCAGTEAPMAPIAAERWSGVKRTKKDFRALCRSYGAAAPAEQVRLMRACAESLKDHAAA